MKTFNHFVVTVTTTVDGDAGAEFFGYEPEVRYHVSALGRGRWQVVESDGSRQVLRTAELQRFFKDSDWVEEYDFDGAPVHAHQEVSIDRDPWWRW